MTNEDLTKPRYKVIANYPGSDLVVGDILIRHTFPENGNYCYVTNPDILLLGSNKRKEEVEAYPHLFKPLLWWEQRALHELPAYVKMKGLIYNVTCWKHDMLHNPFPDCTYVSAPDDDLTPNAEISLSVIWHFCAKTSTPATEEEYNAQTYKP
jgi:hypothetical protein